MTVGLTQHLVLTLGPCRQYLLNVNQALGDMLCRSVLSYKSVIVSPHWVWDVGTKAQEGDLPKGKGRKYQLDMFEQRRNIYWYWQPVFIFPRLLGVTFNQGWDSWHEHKGKLWACRCGRTHVQPITLWAKTPASWVPEILTYSPQTGPPVTPSRNIGALQCLHLQNEKEHLPRIFEQVVIKAHL